VDRTILKMEGANFFERFLPTDMKNGIILKDAVQKKAKHVKSYTFLLL